MFWLQAGSFGGQNDSQSVQNGSQAFQNGSAASPSGSASASVTLPDGSCVVRRKVDDDNSCLFSAVGYVMEGGRAHAAKLRQAWVRMIHGCLRACVLRIAICVSVCVCVCFCVCVCVCVCRCFCSYETFSLTARVCHVTPAMSSAAAEAITADCHLQCLFCVHACLHKA